ncbi:MAG: ATPase [bacterium]|nr:ATPase [bacterium]
MTTDEKLQHFLEFSMKDARIRSEKMLSDYCSALDATYEEHKKESLKRAEMQIQIEKNRIVRNFNKEYSIEQLKIKRELKNKETEFTEMLFTELKDTLARFMETPEYDALLVKQILAAKEVAETDDIRIYMDPVDAAKIPHISMLTKTNIIPSQYSFLGGTRAIVIEKHILIDNSFETKLAEAKDNFHFEDFLFGDFDNVEEGGITHG